MNATVGESQMTKYMSLRTLVSTAIVLTICGHDGHADEAADRTKLVRATFQEASPAILHAKEPIRITQCTFQDEPKVIVLTASDAANATIRFDWYLDVKTSNREPDHFYWMHRKGISEGMYRLAPRGAEEAALYGLLLRYVATQEKAKELRLFDQEMLRAVKTIVGKLDERFGEVPTLER
jgi:hypothetical protein